jgi:Methyltransferase FkbM domain
VDGYRGQRGRVIEVKCRTLDSIVEELNIEPDFLKIDVEGFGHLVLSGASQLLSKFRPHIVLEANRGDPGTAMTQILLHHGYGFHNITDNSLKRRSEIIPVDAYPNWLCVPIS